MVIENYVRAWSGQTGMYALQLADKALEAAGAAKPIVKPTATLADIPYVKSFFVRYPSSGAQPIQDFYDNLNKVETTKNTFRTLQKAGDPNSITSYANTPEFRENMVGLSGFSTALSAQNKMIRYIYANPQIKPDEKRQQIDGIYHTMIQIATQGNKIYEAHKAAMAAHPYAQPAQDADE
jgi:hypothetical protein